MKLDCVTITGADDSIEPGDLQKLSRSFPFVEWGILVSANNTHRLSRQVPRFPSRAWIRELQHLSVPDHGREPSLKLSLHMCGVWVRDLLVGCFDLEEDFIADFQRIQLNFHAERNRIEADGFLRKLDMLNRIERRQFIFQIDGEAGNKHLEAVYRANTPTTPFIDAVPLFDISGGAGIVPSKWPPPLYPGMYHGYAGGLGPDNLREQIPLIAEAAGINSDGSLKTRIWIDMETNVRSNNDQQFDLNKVGEALQICRDFGVE